MTWALELKPQLTRLSRKSRLEMHVGDRLGGLIRRAEAHEAEALQGRGRRSYATASSYSEANWPHLALAVAVQGHGGGSDDSEGFEELLKDMRQAS